MNNTKENKAKRMIIASAIAIMIVLIAELALLINYQQEAFIPIIIFAIIAVIAVYILVNSVMTIEAEKEAKRQEHFDNIYKSEKASYIMLKNRFQEIEEKLATIQETSKIPSEEIINAQKGIAKVIISRSKENADAIINSNDQVLERLDEMDETQNTKFTGISKDQRLKLSEMSNQTELKLQDMVVQLKDMELRLNQAIMQGGGTRATVAEPENFIEPDAFTEQEEFFSEEEIFAEEPFIEDAEEDVLDELETIDSLDDLVVEEIPGEETPVEDILEEIVEDIISEEPVVEDIPPMPDLSDPNKALSPDEIAALIANL